MQSQKRYLITLCGLRDASASKNIGNVDTIGNADIVGDVDIVNNIHIIGNAGIVQVCLDSNIKQSEALSAAISKTLLS